MVKVGDLLHSRGRAGVAVGHRAVDHVKAALPLIQSHLEVGRRSWAGEIDGAVFDIEDTIRRSSGNGRENTTRSIREDRAARLSIGAQIIPIREDEVGAACVRQAGVSEDRERAHKLKCAVGVHVRRSKGLIV